LSASFVIAAPALKPERNKIAETTWVGETKEGWLMTIEFKQNGTMIVSYQQTIFTASWKQDDNHIYYEMNNKYCEFNGKIQDNNIEGKSSNIVGDEWFTKLRLISRR
jgi:hypothetical protein